MALPKIENLENRVTVLEEDTGWVDAELEDGVTASTSGYGGACGIQYRKIGNHVYVRGSVITTYAGSTVSLTKLPYAPIYRPYRLGPLNGTRMSRIYVNSSGYVCLEWIANVSDGSYYTSTPSWLAIDIDFFTD